MSKVAIVIGILLIAVGLAGYLLPNEVVTEGVEGEVVETKRSLTALIPAVVGLPILLCGLLAAAVPAANKTAMHVAATIGLMGALAATGRGVVSLLKFVKAEGDVNQRALAFLVLMGALCWMFVIFCVMSFIRARKAREAESTAN
jgi:hypothetical protein